MLEIKNVSKTYASSDKPALKEISFAVREGEFVAMLGQNGAGKSTLINILAGNVKKDGGTVTIGGYDLDRNELETKRILGVVPQEISFDFVFTAAEVLQNQSGYFGIAHNEEHINGLLQNLALSDKQHENSRALSGGMKRRLLIAKALVHKPKLLILDEPTAGVDIELRHSLFDYLRELRRTGTTIILTTHYLEEAEKLCDRVLVIDEGRLIMDESKDKLLETLGSETNLEFQFETGLNGTDLGFLAKYAPRMEGDRRLLLTVLKPEIGNVFQQLSDRDIHFSTFKIESKKLEDVFLQLVHK
jgi:ABC-2 type transport system ATP-binding protein